MHAVGSRMARLVVIAWIGFAGCSSPDASPALLVALALDRPVATVSDRYPGVAIDTAQLVGGQFWNPGVVSGANQMAPQPAFDFSRRRLKKLVAPLAHGELRIGGTDADRTFYDLGDPPAATPPQNYEWVLTHAEWDAAADFARALDWKMLFTLNAGPGPRSAAGTWQADNARALVAHATSRGDPVEVWELGNEVNAYNLIFGLTVDANTYAGDLATARGLLTTAAPGALLAGPASAYWPIVGEIGGLLPKVLAVGGSALDIVTWHYYPQQSMRCAARVLKATTTTLLDPDNLDEIDRWAIQVDGAARAYAPSAKVWLGETGNAQCGGQPGVSDAFASGFWWLDQLGKMASRGTAMMIRQSLTGADYGLLSEPDLIPRPDYWNTVLWHTLMDGRALAATSPEPGLRAWAQCTRNTAPEFRRGAVTALLINLDDAAVGPIGFSAMAGARLAVYQLTGALDSTSVALGGVTLTADSEGNLPPLAGAPAAGSLTLPPRSYAFVILPDAAAPACP
jgi:heparanase 1